MLVRRAAGPCVLAGGLLMAALLVPFTYAHGPTSVNLERDVGGLDMHGWGFLLGVVPHALIGTGLWSLRDHLSGGRRGAGAAWSIAAVLMLLTAVQTLVSRALGAPFLVPLLALALVVAAADQRPRDARQRRVRAATYGIAMTQAAGFALALVPLETSDGFGGYRIVCVLLYLAGGLGWAALVAPLASGIHVIERLR